MPPLARTKKYLRSQKRHVAKTLTWRLIGTIDTIILSTFLTGDPTIGLSIGVVELFTKMFLYYLHERLWFRIRVFKESGTQIRHILKTFTWRFVGTLDTVILSWFLTGSAEVGMKIGGLELITKMILYYLHERIWYKSKFGLE